MRQDWESANINYTEGNLQPSNREGRQIFASNGARAEFGWLIDKMPEWAGCNLDLITELDITGGIDPSSLDDAALDKKVCEFIAANPSVFGKFTKQSLEYFTSAAPRFARYGAEGAQSFKLDGSEKFRSVLFIESISRRNFAETAQEGLGCSMQTSAFDDAAMTIMHECAHMFKQHSHMSRIEMLQNEAQAEGLMIVSFLESIQERRDLDPRSLQPRLAFRSLQSLIWSEHREIEKINDPLGPDEGFGHGMSAALSLTDSLLTDEQAVALLKAPIQVNTLIDWTAGDGAQERRHYFSAMAALHSGGYFDKNTLAEVYVEQALQACQTYAKEWLDEDLITGFKAKLAKTNPPEVKWDDTDDFFHPQHGKYFDPAVCDPKFSERHI